LIELLPLDLALKQALLETEGAVERLDRLAAVIASMRDSERGGGS
jgi:Lon protease-like protein